MVLVSRRNISNFVIYFKWRCHTKLPLQNKQKYFYLLDMTIFKMFLSVLSNQCSWKRKLIKSWMHGWPSQCVMLLRLSCSMCCARALKGLVRGGSAPFGYVRSHKWETLIERQVERERRPGAACGLDSCIPTSSPRSTRSHIIYDSIRARSKLTILFN